MNALPNTRIVKSTLTAIAALFVVVVSASHAMAQEQLPTPVLGGVDTNRILKEALAAKGVRLERDKYANQYQSQVKEMESSLRTEDQELSQQRGVLAPEVFQQRAQGFQQKLAEFQTQIQDKQERLDFAFQQAMQEIGSTIMVVSSEIAKQRGINAVMARSQLMIFDPSMDITRPVLEKLNERLPSVVFQNPETLQRSAQDAAAEGNSGQ